MFPVALKTDIDYMDHQSNAMLKTKNLLRTSEIRNASGFEGHSEKY